MITQFPRFKKLELSDRAQIESLTSHFQPYSDYNFISLWSWNLDDTAMVSMLGDILVLRLPYYVTQEYCYTFLGTKISYEKICPLLSLAKKDRTAFKLIPEESVINLLTASEIKIEEDGDNFDYIFALDDLTNLSGAKFETLRNLINRFQKRNKENRFEILDLKSRSVCDRVFSLASDWALSCVDGGGDEFEINNELESFDRHLRFASNFDLLATGIFVEDELVAVGTTEITGNNSATAHYRKARKSFSGVYQFLEVKTAELLKSRGIQYLNFEQDLGIMPLRQAKLAYRPVSFLKKYNLFYE